MMVRRPTAEELAEETRRLSKILSRLTYKTYFPRGD